MGQCLEYVVQSPTNYLNFKYLFLWVIVFV